MRTTLILALVLSGCAWTQPPMRVEMTWDRQGATKQQFDEESYACERDAAPEQNVVRKFTQVQHCMESKGWKLRR